MRVRTGVRLGLAALLAVALPLVGSGAAQAKDKRELTVMTQNLYLGLEPRPGAHGHHRPRVRRRRRPDLRHRGLHELPARGPRRSPTRWPPRSPDLVGLQEVSNWIAQPLVPGANPPSYDFLAILQAALAKPGLRLPGRRRLAERRHRPRPARGARVRLRASDLPDDPAVRGDAAGPRRDPGQRRHRRPERVKRRSSGDYTAQQTFQPPGGTARSPSPAAGPPSTRVSTARGSGSSPPTSRSRTSRPSRRRRPQEFLAGPAKHGRRGDRHRRLQLRGRPGHHAPPRRTPT